MPQQFRVPKVNDTAEIEAWLSQRGYRRTVHDTMVIYVRRTAEEIAALRSL